MPVAATLAACDGISSEEVNHALGGRGVEKTSAAAPDASAAPPGLAYWVRIEGGAFEMGADRQVRVATFELARTEATVAQYRACVTARACTAPDAVGSCNWGQPGREDTR